MDLETLTKKVSEHDSLLAVQNENIKSIVKTVEQQGRLLDTVHKMNEVQVEILTEMKYLRTDIGRVEKNLDCVKIEFKDTVEECENNFDERINNVQGKIKGVSAEVDIIKAKPAKRYEKIVDKVIDIVIGILVGGGLTYILTKLLDKI